MAVDFGKLNKAGLAKTSFGSTRKTSGTSAQATKNLANSSAASKSSLFDFKYSGKTRFTPGQNVSKGATQYNYQRLRSNLNSTSFVPRQSMGVGIGAPMYNTGMPNVKVNNDYQNGMILGQTLAQTMNFLNETGMMP